MKKMALAMVFVCLCGSALATDIGLGLSVKSGGTTIYIPIKVSDAFRIEPMLRYWNVNYEERLFPEDSPYTATATRDETTWTLGVGLFGVLELAESASLYYGGRVGYISSERGESFSGTWPPAYIFTGSEQDSDGFLLAPTIGVEYRFSKHFSISGEASLAYEKVEGDESSLETTSTTTDIIFRYMF